ncbi:MAG: hypothetical protein JXQ29_18675 [Planctomycetes bacterium]|nr:hypothetical protein [Planctomycetota bacterium]
MPEEGRADQGGAGGTPPAKPEGSLEAIQTDLAKTRQALEVERRMRSEYATKLKDYGERSPEDVAKAFKTLEQLEREAKERDRKAGDKGPDPKIVQLETMVNQFKEQLEAEKKARQEERGRYVSKQMDAAAGDAIMAHVTDPSDIELLKPHLLKVMVVEQSESGEPIFRVRGDDGQPVLVTKSGESTDPVTILKEYVGTNMKKRFPKSFAGTMARGAGMSGSDAKTPERRFEVKRGASPQEYQRIRAEALKVGEYPTIIE